MALGNPNCRRPAALRGMYAPWPAAHCQNPLCCDSPGAEHLPQVSSAPIPIPGPILILIPIPILICNSIPGLMPIFIPIPILPGSHPGCSVPTQ